VNLLALTMRTRTIKAFSAFILILLSFNLNAQQQIMMDAAANGTTVNTCNGFIIDSGGQGGAGYGNNETIVVTICPDTPGEIISIVFNLFNLDLTDDNPAPNITNVDIMNVYDGTSTAANSLGSYSGNQLQGVVIQATALNPTGCITLEFISNTVGTGMFTASVACETPCDDPQASGGIINGITSDSIRVCVGDSVFFQDLGSIAQPGFTLASWEWDFMDGNTAVGQNVGHTYTTPGQYRVQLFVTDDNGCTNPNLIDLQVLVATLPDFTGFPGDTSICLGESVSFTATPEAYEVTWTGFPGSQSVDDGCLPDTLLGVSQDIDLLQTGFSAGTTINNVSDIQSICLELEHSFMGDLVLIIQCPNGQNVTLHQQGGGGTQIGIPVQADNVDCNDPTTIGTPFNYCFTPTATETWVDWVNNNGFGQTLPAGNYASVNPLSGLVGCPTNGVWTLTVIDNWAADDGTLFSFGLNLDPSFYPPVQTFEPQIGPNSDSSSWVVPAPHVTNLSPDGNTIDVDPTAAGSFTYDYFVIDDFGCTNDTSVTLTVEPNPIVFAGNDTTLCGGSPVQLNGLLSGPGSNSDCDYNLLLEDTFGDGWNGNTITITINGVSTDYTLNAGSTTSIPLQIPNGTNITITFNANGAFVGECFYSLVDENGVAVVAQGPNLPGVTVDNYVTACAPDFVYEWTPAGSLNDPAILDPIFNSQTTETLTLTVYPLGHPLCAETDDITINISSFPNAGVDADVDFCTTGTPADLFPLLGPTAEVGGSWEDANGVAVAMPYDPSIMPPGDYSYIVDNSGCADTAIVTVNHFVAEINNVTISDISCNGLTDGSITVDGVGIDLYSLNNGQPVPTGSPFTLNGLSAGNYLIQIASLDGCLDDTTVTITEPAPLSASTTTVDASCFGVCDGQVQVTSVGGTAPYAYNWNQGVIGDQNGSSTTLCAGSYSIDVLDANGCSTSALYEIVQPDNIIPTLLVDDNAGCNPHTVNFTNTTSSNNIFYTLVDFGDGLNDSVVGTSGFSHDFSPAGDYDVTLTMVSNDGCFYTHTFEDIVTVYANPIADFYINPNPVTILDPEVNLINDSEGPISYNNWVIESGDPGTSTQEDVFNVTFPEGVPANYGVTLAVGNDEGCTDTITKFVIVNNEVILFAPNAFTPDDDEHNQTWRFHISGIDIYDFNVRLFNRWGETVWESNDPSVGWDGTYAGRYVQDGTYTWFMECKDEVTDKKYTFQGHVTVLR